MKRHDRARARGPRDRPGLKRSEVLLLRRVLAVRVEKYRLDKQEIGIAHELDDPAVVRRVKHDVGDVTELLSTDKLERRLQGCKRNDLLVHAVRLLPPNADRGVVGRAFERGALELREPRAGLESHLRKTVLPHIDVRFLLDRKPEAWSAVIEQRTADAEVSFIHDHAVCDAAVG